MRLGVKMDRSLCKLVRLSPTRIGKCILPLQSPLFTRGKVSTSRAKPGRQTAFEERGEVQLQSLSPRLHLSLRRGGRARSSAGLGLRAARCQRRREGSSGGGERWRRTGPPCPVHSVASPSSPTTPSRHGLRAPLPRRRRLQLRGSHTVFATAVFSFEPPWPQCRRLLHRLPPSPHSARRCPSSPVTAGAGEGDGPSLDGNGVDSAPAKVESTTVKLKSALVEL
jgi:hypothetical protein